MKKKKLIANVDPDVYEALAEEAYRLRVSRSTLVNAEMAKKYGIDLAGSKKKISEFAKTGS